MKKLTNLIPQADDMSKVLKTVEAVSKGYKTDDEIAKYIGLVARQGRYYRKASEILEFTERIAPNQSILTNLGREFLASSDSDQLIMLQEAMIKNPFFAEIISRLKAAGEQGIGDEEIKNAVYSITQTTTSMAERRRASIKSWLKYAQIATQKGSKIYIAKKIPGPAIIKTIDDPTIQIFRPNKKLKVFVPRDFSYSDIDSKQILKSVEYTFDEAKKEKANKIHKNLVYMMAQKISKAGGIPIASNQSIDLATILNDKKYIFEMKSLTDESIHAQIRRGIAQLYEYRYLHDMPDAILCLVLEKKITGKMAWLIDYLIDDRNIMVCWKNNSGFECPSKCKALFEPFLY